MKTNQIDVVAFTVFRHFEKIEHTQKTGLSGQLRSNVDKPDQSDRINLDFPLSHAITLAFFDMGARPNSDAAGYFSLNHSCAKALCEHHYDAPLAAMAG